MQSSNFVLMQFFQVEEFRNVVLKCLTEIGSLQVGAEYDEKFVVFYKMVLEGIKVIMPVTAGIQFLTKIWQKFMKIVVMMTKTLFRI